MSDGRFIIANYEREDGTNGPIRVQPETVTSWNPQAAGSRTGLFIRARGSKRRYGTNARSVTIARSVGDGSGFNSGTVSLKIPVFTKAAWNDLNAGENVTYGGLSDWVVVGTNAEETK